MDKIIWKQEMRLLSELIPYDKNPRKIPKDKYKALINNIKENGYTNRLIVNQANLVLGGNQRLEALKELGYKEVEVLIPNQVLTSEQEQRINITDNLSAGDWDFDILSSAFEPIQLMEWGMPESWLYGKEANEGIPIDNEKKESKTKMCPACGEILNG
jgi:ParB-like nuclease domain